MHSVALARIRFLLLVLPFALPACRKEEITTYRVPKDPAAEKQVAAAGHAHGDPGSGAAPASRPAAGGSRMANTPVPTAGGPGLSWQGAAHWQEKGASGMRKGTFTITGDTGATAELAITAFPGDVGGEVANVNRWRSQIQLPPQSADEVSRSIQRVEHNGLTFGMVELANNAGGTATRVLGAMVPYQGATWFFKLSGPDALVAREKPAFMEFLATVKPSGAAK